jgi:membrane-bound lytic murein transglycosylase D
MEKFKIITTETVVQTVKKEPKAALASVDVKSLKPKRLEQILAANTATVYIVQRDNLTTIEKNNVTVAKIKELNPL